MGIINRDLDPTQQVETYDAETGVTGVSQLIYFGMIPYQGQIVRIASSAFGVSGTPNLGVQIQRFVTGAGLTTIPVNGSSLLAVTALSTSGIQVHSLPTYGASLVQLLAGDNIQIVTSGANSAATYTINVVVQCLQDIKTQFGLNLSN
jgi:hypothetical protein